MPANAEPRRQIGACGVAAIAGLVAALVCGFCLVSSAVSRSRADAEAAARQRLTAVETEIGQVDAKIAGDQAGLDYGEKELEELKAGGRTDRRSKSAMSAAETGIIMSRDLLRMHQEQKERDELRARLGLTR